MNWKSFVLSGIASGIVIFLVSTIVNLMVSAVWPYNVLELPGVRSVNDPIMALFFLHPLVLGFGLTIAYEKISSALKGDALQKGIAFGSLAWVIAGLPSAFLVFSSMTYPIGFTINSLIGSAIYLIVAGIVIAKVQE